MNNLKKVTFASLGGAFEYYDFAIYAMFATVMGKHFFDYSSPVTNTLMVFLVLASSYLIRPLGAIAFGFIGDKYNRITVLKITMILLFISTLGIAILPGAESIGYWSIILFIVFRCIQGMAVGAEIPVAVVYTTENFPNRQGLVTGIIFGFLSFGILMTTVMFYLLHAVFSEEFVVDYGWRIAFAVGAFFTLFVYMLRKGLTDNYESLLEKSQEQMESFMGFIGKVFLGILLVAVIAMLTTQFYILLPSFYTSFLTADSKNFDISQMLLIGSVFMTISCFIGGFISDYVSKKKMMAFLLIIIIAIVPIFYKNLLDGQGFIKPFIIISIVMGLLAPTYNVIIVNSFLTSYKSRGLGISYNFGYMLFSAPIPAITILLIEQVNTLFIPMALVIVTAIISMIALVLINKYTKQMA